ncbi:MAG: DMT family transporter [Ruminococcaceae bacterium]|nr:DMT family transporter [Oscillospiraceae bacterium]
MKYLNQIFRDSRYKPFLAAFCAVGWSLAYPLIKLGYSEFNIAGNDLGGKVLFAGIRFFVAGLLIILFCIFRKRKLELKKKSDFSLLLLFGLVNTSLHYMFAYIGLGYNSGARSTIIDSFGSFLLIILATILFKDEKVSALKAVGCFLGLSGIVFATVRYGDNIFADITLKGDGMILFNALFAAIGGILTRIVSNKMNMMPATGISMAFGGALMIICALIIGLNKRWLISVKGIIILIILILISAICFAVYNELIANHPISEISIFNALIPVLGVIFSSILLKEELKYQYIVSVIIVSIGIYLVNKKSIKKSAEVN